MATTRTNSAGKALSGSWESEEREHPQGCSFFCALSSARRFCSPKGLLLSLHRAGGESKGPFSFAKENGPFGTPRERLRLAVQSLNDLCASGMRLPARGVAALGVARRFASAPIIRCRSAHLVEVQPNSRLPRHSSMRRAQQCRIRQAVCRQAIVTRASR